MQSLKNIFSHKKEQKNEQKIDQEKIVITNSVYSVPSYSHITKKVGIAAIGVGARLQSLLIDLLYTHGGLVELKAIADDSEEAIAITVKQLREFKFDTFTNYNEMLEKVNDDVEWILIGSKNCLHKDHCIAAFRAGKHVFCEKPLAISLDQCEEIKQEHVKSGKLFATGFVLRHAPLYNKMKNIVLDTEKFGKIVSVEACENIPPEHGGYIMRNWRRHRAEAGPHILEKCCHDIDLLLWIVGSLPSRVAAFGGTNIFVPENAPTDAEEKDRYKWWPAWENVDPFTVEKDIEDNIVVILEFRNNVRVTFHANSNSAIPQRKIHVCGTKGTVEGELYNNKLQYDYTNPNSKITEEVVQAIGIHGGGDKFIVDDLAKCIETNKAPKASGEDALVSAIVCLAIDQAREEKRVVDLEAMWTRFGFEHKDEIFRNWKE